MNTTTRRLGQHLPRLILLAVLALLALYPSGPYRTAHAAASVTLAHTIHLPLVLGGTDKQPVPDLRFEPDNVKLDPGTETRVTVRVEPAADLRGATFELPGVQDGVTSHFAAAADGKTGTLTLQASSAVAADNRAITVQGRSGIDSLKVWVGMLTN